MLPQLSMTIHLTNQQLAPSLIKLPKTSNQLNRQTHQVLTHKKSQILNLKFSMLKDKLDRVHKCSTLPLTNSLMTFLQLNTQLSQEGPTEDIERNKFFSKKICLVSKAFLALIMKKRMN